MCAFSRRRAKQVKLLTCIRKFTAICLKFGIRAIVRWLPSELHWGDLPSRYQDTEQLKSQAALLAVDQLYASDGRGQSRSAQPLGTRWAQKQVELYHHVRTLSHLRTRHGLP